MAKKTDDKIRKKIGTACDKIVDDALDFLCDFGPENTAILCNAIVMQVVVQLSEWGEDIDFWSLLTKMMREFEQTIAKSGSR